MSKKKVKRISDLTSLDAEQLAVILNRILILEVAIQELRIALARPHVKESAQYVALSGLALQLAYTAPVLANKYQELSLEHLQAEKSQKKLALELPKT